jgi:uncharacterized protein
MAPPRAQGRSTRSSRSVKVVVTGPFGAGKTTLIKTISEITVLSTERKVTDDTKALKTQTTVAMDFGRLTVDRDLALYLFGTPGQKRFDFMWEILAEGMLGFIVLVDAGRDGSFPEAEEILAFFREAADVPYVVAVNKSDHDPHGAVEHARARLGLDDRVRVVACNALDKESVKGVLLELLYAVLEDVEAAEPAAV